MSTHESRMKELQKGRTAKKMLSDLLDRKKRNERRRKARAERRAREAMLSEYARLRLGC